MKKNKKVFILNYGLNNVRSLYAAFIEIGVNPIIINDWKEINKSNHLVLPGVGAFSKGIENLKKFGYYDEILNHQEKKRPILGICLGMQMLFEESEEFGNFTGIGLLKGKVKKLPLQNSMKLPNVGWYSLDIDKQNNLENKINLDTKFYFNHGYYCKPENNKIILTRSNYGNFEFCSSIRDELIMGSQFHPEKSSIKGLDFLKIFIKT